MSADLLHFPKQSARPIPVGNVLPTFVADFDPDGSPPSPMSFETACDWFRLMTACGFFTIEDLRILSSSASAVADEIEPPKPNPAA
jgi:hypothetical protein